MSREIKFRAWDKIDDKLRQVININFNTKEIILLNEYTKESYTRNFEDCVLMQYTGVEDKNGKEIYEGDIDQYGYVVTYVGDFGSGLDMNAGWYLQRDNFESWSELECNEDIEIIGNVFNNPEKAKNNCNTDYSKLF
jgi:uncharacterized phage protein (TIGR01671 family)